MNKYILLIFILLGGCDSRKCLKSHDEMMMYMITIPSGNSSYTIPQWMPVTVCDSYENKDKGD